MASQNYSGHRGRLSSTLKKTQKKPPKKLPKNPKKLDKIYSRGGWRGVRPLYLVTSHPILLLRYSLPLPSCECGTGGIEKLMMIDSSASMLMQTYTHDDAVDESQPSVEHRVVEGEDLNLEHRYGTTTLAHIMHLISTLLSHNHLLSICVLSTVQCRKIVECSKQSPACIDSQNVRQ